MRNNSFLINFINKPFLNVIDIITTKINIKIIKSREESSAFLYCSQRVEHSERLKWWLKNAAYTEIHIPFRLVPLHPQY